MSHARGFTLIEVLAALVVLAIAMAAVLSGMARYADTAHHLRLRTLAMWVAQNQLSEVMSQPQWPEEGNQDDTADMGGFEWEWETTVQATQDPALRRIDIVVRDADGENRYAQLSTFMRNPSGSGGTALP